VVAATVLVGLLAALSIWSLHHHADDRRQAQVVLAHIDGLARHLPGTEWYAESQHKFTPGLQTNMTEVQRELDDALATLARLDGTSTVAHDAATAFARYKTDVLQLFNLIAAGDTAAAHTWDEQHLGPSCDALLGLLQHASAAYDSEASQALRMADIGTVATLLVAGGLLGLLFQRFVKARRAYEAELARRALEDGLTGLPNRASFLDTLKRSLAAARQQRQSLAVLFIDLDGFKRVNDRLEHAAGDQLLVRPSRPNSSRAPAAPPPRPGAV
jgi:predicted signal transduction protein with EAL and GGDEF domain